MTRLHAPLVRTELALVLLVLSLLAPRLAGLGPKAFTAAFPTESARAAVGYAQHRLWSDFVLARRETVSGRSLPDPTLSEYRHFLAGLGLKRRGDAASLLVWPPLDREKLSEKIEVQLSEARPPLALKVFVADPDGKPQYVGRLEIRVDAFDVVTCWAEAEREPNLLTFWPVRPGPLLP